MFSSIILGSKMTPKWVFLGASLAFLAQVIISVAVGGLVSKLPRQPLNIAVGIVFLIGALLIVREILSSETEEEEALARKSAHLAPFKQALVAFSVTFIAEFGDLTQIATANLAAKSANPLSVGIGAYLGLLTITALAVYFGSTLLSKVPLRPVQYASIAIMGGLGIFTLVNAI